MLPAWLVKPDLSICSVHPFVVLIKTSASSMKATGAVRIFEDPHTSGNVSHWLRHIEMVAATNEWSETQKCAAAVACLKGTAAYWLDTFAFTSWDEFAAGIKVRFAEDPDRLLDDIMAIKQYKPV